MHSQLHSLHLEKRICEFSAFLQKCIYSYIGCFCKKNSQCQWSLASQENRIGFVGFGVCFDLLGPKFSFRARRLKKGAWVKREGEEFDITMGSYDGAETTDLVGLFLLHQLKHLPVNLGLYRDDGLAVSALAASPSSR